MDYYGLMSDEVREYLDAAHERLTLADGFAVWRLRAPPSAASRRSTAKRKLSDAKKTPPGGGAFFC
jgi:hypothetical protein